MVEGGVLGEGGAFVVEGVLEVDFEEGEDMAGGGKLMPVCNICPIGIFAMLLRRNTTALSKHSASYVLACQHKEIWVPIIPRLP